MARRRLSSARIALNPISPRNPANPPLPYVKASEPLLRSSPTVQQHDPAHGPWPSSPKCASGTPGLLGNIVVWWSLLTILGVLLVLALATCGDA
jgi:hypothetical protein